MLSIVLVATMLPSVPGNSMQVKAAGYEFQAPHRSEDYNDMIWDGIWFGSYYQNDIYGTTKEPILWRVLSVEGNDALLIANQNLDIQKYNDSPTNEISMTWEKATIRSWLNGYSTNSNCMNKDYSGTGASFFDVAFSEEEQTAILPTMIADENKSTTDDVFLLSKEEMKEEKYGFSSYIWQMSSDTDYVDARINFNLMAGSWLRSLASETQAYFVNAQGSSSSLDNWNYNAENMKVRPAIHLDLSKTDLWSYAGTVTEDDVIDSSEAEYTPLPIPEVELTSDGVEVVNGVATAYNGKLNYISIPDTATKIADNFQCARKLRKVHIKSSVKTIGESAFLGQKYLTEVKLHRTGLEEIKKSAFSGCVTLSDVSLPDTLITIGEAAFFECGSLENITFPATLRTIGNRAFMRCGWLSKIILNEGLTSIGNDAFNRDSCDYALVSEIYIPGSVKDIPETAFYGWGSAKTLTIGEGVETIGESAFYGAKSIQSINLPDSLKSIGASAFERCWSAESLTWSDSVEFVGEEAFNQCSSLSSVTIPTGITAIPARLFWGCTAMEAVTFHNAINSIGDYAFSSTGLRTVDLPDSVETIGIEAFSNNGSLRRFTFGSGTKTIEYGMLSKTGITTIELPENMTSIPKNMFKNCTRLQKINCSKNLQTIGEGAFYGCASLAFFPFTEYTLTMIEKEAFRSSGLQYALIPEGITELSEGIFRDCSSLIRVDLHKNTKTIGSYAFDNSGIQALIVPEGVETIGEYAVRNCAYLTGVSLPETLTNLEQNFMGCTNLQQIVLPAGVTEIKGYTFYSAFNGPSAQVTIIKGNITSVSDSAYVNMASKTTIYGIPNSALEDFAKAKGIAFYTLENAPAVEPVTLPEIPIQLPEDLIVEATGSESAYYYDGYSVEILGSGTYHISMTEGVTQTSDIICVNLGSGEVTLVLDDVNIHAVDNIQYGYSGSYGMPGLWIATNSTANVTVKLKGENELHGSFKFPGVQKYGFLDSAGTLTFECGEHEDCDGHWNQECGSLYANGFDTVGIGSYSEDNRTRNITFKSGKITANGIGSDIAKNIVVEGGQINTLGQGFMGADIMIKNAVMKVGTLGIFTMLGGSVDVQSLANPSSSSYQKGSLRLNTAENLVKDNTALTLVALSGCAGVINVRVDGTDWGITANHIEDDQLYLYLTKEEHSITVTTLSGTKTYTLSWNNDRAVIPGMEVATLPEGYQTSLKTVSISGIETKHYMGQLIQPITLSLTLKDKEYTLIEGVDYTVSYENNTQAGTARVTIIGKGYYKGTISENFLIYQLEYDPAPTPPGNTPSPTSPGTNPNPTNSSDNLDENNNPETHRYTITFQENGGSYVANKTITSGNQVAKPSNPTKSGYTFAGWYQASKKYNFNTTVTSNVTLTAKWRKVTKPSKPSINKVTRKSSKMTLKLKKKVSGAKGYEIVYATNSKFNKNKNKILMTGTAKTISNIKKGKIYYVKVRAYKVDSIGTKVFGTYSSTKKVKIK